jgi:hypothetical protein
MFSDACWFERVMSVVVVFWLTEMTTTVEYTVITLKPLLPHPPPRLELIRILKILLRAIHGQRVHANGRAFGEVSIENGGVEMGQVRESLEVEVFEAGEGLADLVREIGEVMGAGEEVVGGSAEAGSGLVLRESVLSSWMDDV